MAPAINTFSFASPVEGKPLFLPALESLQTLYPGSYAWVTTYTTEGAETLDDLDVKLSTRTYTGAAGLD